MRAIMVFGAAAALVLASCSEPPADTLDDRVKAPEISAEDPSPAPVAPPRNYGPYQNAWDSNEVSTFRHVLWADGAGSHRLVLGATTDSPGGETVRVYRQAEDGSRGEAVMFVIATTRGGSATKMVEFPSDEEGVPVIVAVENASGRRLSGNYTLRVDP